MSLAVLLFSFSSLVIANAFLKSKAAARTFTVSAEGKVVALPDIAEFNYEIITEGDKDLSSIQEENSLRSNSVNAYLKEHGVAEKDIKTVGYNINPRYQSIFCSPGVRICPPSEIVGYTVTNSVQVKVRELQKVGELLSGVVKNGANSASSLTFSIDDVEKIQSQARDIAIQKAKTKAKEIATSAKVQLGSIVSINEDFQIPFRLPQFAKSLSIAEEAGATPPTIEPGSQEVKVNVVIMYEIR